MPELQRVTFEELPATGEEPLEGEDVLQIMRWAVESRRYIRSLQEGMAETATIWLDRGKNASPYPDASVQLLPVHTPIERTDQVDLALRYPQARQAAA